MSWRRRLTKPRRNEAWLSQRLGLALEQRGPLRTTNDWAWLVDWMAGQLGCDVDFEVLGPATLLVMLGPDCPTDERGAALAALVDHTPREVWVHVSWFERRPEVAA